VPPEERKEPISILVAEDHAIVREGIVSILRNDPDFLVVGQAADGNEAVRIAESVSPKIVVLDVTMPRLNGLTAASLIRRLLPRTGIVMLTVHADQAYVTQALAAGARGYVLKQSLAAELVEAIRVVNRGGVYLSPELTACPSPGDLSGRDFEEQLQQVASRDGLTPREVEVLQLIAEGLSNKEMAQTLAVSVKTVETHRARLMAKLGIHDTAGLVRYAIRKRIVEA
jgi:DNA-binding NarL/FixJ family response regulator